MKAIQKTYQAPKLIAYGTIRDLTQAGGGQCNDHPIGDSVACPTRS